MPYDEQEVEALRKEMGQKAALDGEGLHENSSESFAKGFKKAYNGWGSNVTPRRFGFDPSLKRGDWTCVCGNVNKGHIRKMKAKREVCFLCEVEREVGEV